LKKTIKFVCECLEELRNKNVVVNDMFLCTEDIQNQIIAGEDLFGKFSLVKFAGGSVFSPTIEDIAGDMVAFANAAGGSIFFGVSYQGIVRGVSRSHVSTVEQWVINTAYNNCDPPIRPVIRKVMLPDVSGNDVLVLIASIPKSHSVHRTSGGRWYIRVGSTKRDLTQQELGRLFQQRGRISVFDELAVPTATEPDINMETLKAFFGSSGEIPFSDLLLNTRIMIKDEEGIVKPTVTGLLFFGHKPQTHLMSAYIEAAVYKGLTPDSNALVHSESIVGSVVDQIDDAIKFVKRFMLKPAVKDAGREDHPQYAISAVHEAIVNAVAHRDYSISGSKIRLFLYDDRLEIMSPGKLPNTITLENMPYSQFTRNQLLVSFLSKMQSNLTGRAFIESRGEGVRKILSESKAHSGRDPFYQLIGEELMLTIWAKPSPHD